MTRVLKSTVSAAAGLPWSERQKVPPERQKVPPTFPGVFKRQKVPPTFPGVFKRTVVRTVLGKSLEGPRTVGMTDVKMPGTCLPLAPRQAVIDEAV